MRGAQRFLLFCLALLPPGVSLGQITVPPTVESHKPICATLAAPLPEGAKIKGGWTVSAAEFLQVSDTEIHIWAAPGVHEVTYQGAYVVTRDVTIEGQVIPVLVDFGQFNYRASFTVGQSVPPVPPPVPGKRRGLIVEETSQRTPAQKSLYLELRKAFSDQLLPIVDRSHPPAAWAAAVSATGTVAPALVVIAADGSVLRVVPLPSTVAAIQAELSK
jgi:hypothetical protein